MSNTIRDNCSIVWELVHWHSKYSMVVAVKILQLHGKGKGTLGDIHKWECFIKAQTERTALKARRRGKGEEK